MANEEREPRHPLDATDHKPEEQQDERWARQLSKLPTMDSLGATPIESGKKELTDDDIRTIAGVDITTPVFHFPKGLDNGRN